MGNRPAAGRIDITRGGSVAGDNDGITGRRCIARRAGDAGVGHQAADGSGVLMPAAFQLPHRYSVLTKTLTCSF